MIFFAKDRYFLLTGCPLMGDPIDLSIISVDDCGGLMRWISAVGMFYCVTEEDGGFLPLKSYQA